MADDRTTTGEQQQDEDEPMSKPSALASEFLKAPEGVVGASVDGHEYRVSKKGRVEAALRHVPQLLEHGFTRVAP